MSVDRIDVLTEAQRARMDSWADEWIARGLSTERADWDSFERGARQCYEFAGLAPPRVIVRCSSPLVAMLAASIADQIIGKVAVGGAVHDAVGDAVGGAVRGAVHDAVRGAVHDAVDGAVRGAVGDAVHDAVGGAVDGAVGGAVDGIRPWWTTFMGGQFWLSWQAYESFFREVCDLHLPTDARAAAYAQAQSAACWWISMRWGIMVSDRPLVIHREQTGLRGWGSHRLHCEDGPAIVWPDGWGVWAIHDVRVPRHVVEQPETITLDEIRSERNAEVRRIMRERYGESRYMLETGAKVLDSDRETCRKGAAPRVLVEDDGGQRWLIGTDGSTSRTYHMPVDAGIATCKAAHESLCGFDESVIINKS